MMNRNLKLMVKKILAGVMACTVIFGFTSVKTFAAEPDYICQSENIEHVQMVMEKRAEAANEGIGNLKVNGNTYSMNFLYPDAQIPEADAPIDVDQYGYCTNGCKNIMTTYIKTAEGYEYVDSCLDCLNSQGCPIQESDCENIPEFQQFLNEVNGNSNNVEVEESVKEEPVQVSNYDNKIKEERQMLIDLGVNNRSNTNEFKVFVNSSESSVKLDVNDEINTDESGICKGEHRTVCYYTKQGDFLVHVSKCFDCLDQKITNIDSVMDGMNVVGSSEKANTVESEKEVNYADQYEDNIKYERDYLLSYGLNDVAEKDKFEVTLSSNEKDTTLNLNDEINVNKDGLCNGEHRIVSYDTVKNGKTVHISQCFDCYFYEQTDVDSTENKTDLLESNMFDHLTEEEILEIMNNYRLVIMQEAVNSLE